MLDFNPGQGSQDFGEMPAHGFRRSIFVARVDGGHDAAVLVDERQHRLRAREGELADPVHVSLDILYGLPGQRTAGTFGQCDMKKFVITLKGRVIVPACGLFLHFQEVADPLPALPVEG